MNGSKVTLAGVAPDSMLIVLDAALVPHQLFVATTFATLGAGPVVCEACTNILLPVVAVLPAIRLKCKLMVWLGALPIPMPPPKRVEEFPVIATLLISIVSLGTRSIRMPPPSWRFNVFERPAL